MKAIHRRDDGFTLIELLVVILIISILAAIAIPVFLRQREKSYTAQAKSTLKNAALAAESYAADPVINGDFSGLDGDDGTLLAGSGYKATVGVTISVVAAPNEYCFTVTHSRLPAGHPWAISTWNSSEGSPQPRDADLC